MPLWTDPQALADLQAAHAQQDLSAAERWMRVALAELVIEQAAPAPAQPTDVEPAAAPDLLALGVPAPVLQALQTARAEQPGSPPAGQGLALLLRGQGLIWEEAEELDWAVRYWEAARKAGIAWNADFGECWRQFEFGAVLLLLEQLAAIDPLCDAALPRFALLVRTATRYREVAPLLAVLERMRPGVTQRGFG